MSKDFGHEEGEGRPAGALQGTEQITCAGDRARSHRLIPSQPSQNNYLEIRSGPSEFRIVGLTVQGFPALSKFEKVPFVGVEPDPRN
ncbi:MAG TPA: hypothetical protein VMK42_11110 [Anaeromyxobacteraceae bacterium]|nr:hypothetical protein [Anaeromyxobacteraceae bacterium]